MLSEKIAVKNFKGIRAADLDLRNIDAAVVLGHNGAGKSSLIVDARLWAVFGESSSLKDLDKHVQNGADMAEVVYEWTVGGEHYRVTRKRSVRTSRGTSALMLEQSENGGWKDRSGESIGETEEKILKAFPIDMTTLVNSSIIEQGEVESFCKATPGDRAKILSKILNQERYKELERLARKEGNDVRGEIKRIDGQVGENKVEIDKTGEAEKTLGEAKDALRNLDGEIEEKERSKGEKEKDLVGLQQATKDYEGWKKELVEVSEEIEALTQEITADSLEIERYQKILEDKDTVKGKIEEADRVKEKGIELSSSLKTVQAKMEAMQDHLLSPSQRADMETEISECKTVIARKEEIERIVEKGDGIEQQLKSVKERKALRDELIEKQQTVKMRLKECEHDLAMLNEKVERMEQKTKLLDDIQCHPEEDPGYVNKACPFLKDAVDAKDGLDLARKDRGGASDALSGFVTALDRLAKELESYEGIDEAVDDIEARYAEFNAAKKDLVMLDTVVKKVQGIEAELKKDEKLQAEYAARKLESKKLEEEIETLRTAFKEFEQFTKLAPKIENAEARLPLMEQKNRKDLKNREGLAERKGSFEAKIKDADELFSSKCSLETEVQTLGEALVRCKEMQAEKNKAVGMCEAIIERGRQLVERNKELLKKVDQLKEEVIDWEILEEGFRQLPFLVYEKAVPEIEHSANEILSSVSSEGMQVSIETQRAAKTTKNVADEIGLHFVDNDGEKDYAQLSGGERVRASLAIRLALGELSGRRAGERIEELTIDEGWSGLDAEGLEAVKECLHRLRNRFKKILVISHLEGVKDLFETKLIMDKHAEEQMRVVSNLM